MQNGCNKLDFEKFLGFLYNIEFINILFQRLNYYFLHGWRESEPKPYAEIEDPCTFNLNSQYIFQHLLFMRYEIVEIYNYQLL